MKKAKLIISRQRFWRENKSGDVFQYCTKKGFYVFYKNCDFKEYKELTKNNPLIITELKEGVEQYA